MFNRIKCLLRGHKFDLILAKSFDLEVRQCTCCGMYLNMNHSMQEAFIDRKITMIKEINMLNSIMRGAAHAREEEQIQRKPGIVVPFRPSQKRIQ